MSDNNWKWSNKDFKGISPEMWKKSYETWLIIKEMGMELLMTFYPNGNVTFGSGKQYNEEADSENAVVRAAMDEWKRRNSSFLENVIAMATPLAGANAGRGVDVIVTVKHG